MSVGFSDGGDGEWWSEWSVKPPSGTGMEELHLLEGLELLVRLGRSTSELCGHSPGYFRRYRYRSGSILTC